MDSRWEAYEPEYTQELFDEITESLISPNKHVPDIIKQKLSQVKSVYRLRSIDYELQDVAILLMIICFELALRTKYETVKEKKTKKGLRELLKWAKNNNHLNIDIKQIEIIVKIRNGIAHIKRPEDLHGTLSSYTIKPINDWINELYTEG